MLTFTCNSAGTEYQQRVMESIAGLRAYFAKYNGIHTDEAIQRAYLYAVQSQNDYYSDLTPYMKRLAKTVMMVKSRETPYDVQDESGEVAYSFRGLVTDDVQAVMDKAQLSAIRAEVVDLYLIDPLQFMMLEDSISSFSEVRVKFRNKELEERLKFIIRKYDNRMLYSVLAQFFKELNTSRPQARGGIREINIRQVDYEVYNIPTTPFIVDEKGNRHKINPNTFKCDVNLDMIKWTPDVPISGDIYRINIDKYMGYVYEKIFTTEGVNTDLIKWYDGRYKVNTPAGDSDLNCDRSFFVEVLCYQELVLNIITSGIGQIVGTTEDSIYFMPKKKPKFNTLRARLLCGKVIDMPVELHSRKASGSLRSTVVLPQMVMEN